MLPLAIRLLVGESSTLLGGLMRWLLNVAVGLCTLCLAATLALALIHEQGTIIDSTVLNPGFSFEKKSKEASARKNTGQICEKGAIESAENHALDASNLETKRVKGALGPGEDNNAMGREFNASSPAGAGTVAAGGGGMGAGVVGRLWEETESQERWSMLTKMLKFKLDSMSLRFTNFLDALANFIRNDSHTHQLVLIDHGLHDNFPPKFRRQYCPLWKALTNGNEAELAAVSGAFSYNILVLYACVRESNGSYVGSSMGDLFYPATLPVHVGRCVRLWASKRTISSCPGSCSSCLSTTGRSAAFPACKSCSTRLRVASRPTRGRPVILPSLINSPSKCIKL